MIFVFFGPPGCGKGTVASYLKETFGARHISTGDLLREEVSKLTDIGISIKESLACGCLIDDDIVFSLLTREISGREGTLVIDGFPRTLDQAQRLDSFLSTIVGHSFFFVRFVVQSDFLVKRILGRFSCAQCGAIYNDFFKIPFQGICEECGFKEFQRRADDTEDALRNRLDIYFDQEAVLLNHYCDRMNDVDASLSLDEVRSSFLKKFGFES